MAGLQCRMTVRPRKGDENWNNSQSHSVNHHNHIWELCMIPPEMAVGLERREVENNCLMTAEHRPGYKDLNRLKEIRMEVWRPNTSSLTKPENSHSTRSTITGQEQANTAPCCGIPEDDLCPRHWKLGAWGANQGLVAIRDKDCW